MAILANNSVRTGLQVVLALVILFLGYFLYRTIREPQEAFERELAITEATRARMIDVRDAMRTYEREYDRFPSTLDSLVMLIKNDSLFVAKRDSIFNIAERDDFDPDSIIYSTRPGNPRFNLTVVDTSEVAVYLLEDPGSEDFIGTADPRRAAGMLNAASWE